MFSSIYTFKDVIFFSKKHKMIVIDDIGKEVGSVVRAHHNEQKNEKFRKGTFYAYEDVNGELLTSIAVKKLGLKSLKGYSYHLHEYQKKMTYELNDVKWVSYIYFHIKGNINDIKFEAYQDWDNKLILKADKVKFATISFDELTFKVTIKITDHPDSFLIHPSFLTQIYCMYRLYDMESKVIEELLF